MQTVRSANHQHVDGIRLPHVRPCEEGDMDRGMFFRRVRLGYENCAPVFLHINLGSILADQSNVLLRLHRHVHRLAAHQPSPSTSTSTKTEEGREAGERQDGVAPQHAASSVRHLFCLYIPGMPREALEMSPSLWTDQRPTAISVDA